MCPAPLSTSSPLFSAEQQAIIDFVVESCKKRDSVGKGDGVNVVVEAVAGSGKTHTISGIGKHISHQTVLVLTYNRTLCDETKTRFKSLGIKNVHAYTYHGFVYKYYDSSGNTDAIIDNTVTENINPKQMYACDIAVLDEFQDLNPRLFSLTLKLLRDIKLMHGKMPILVFLGDSRQCVYQSLHGSDSRYLTYANEIFSFAGPFKRFPLRTSRRLPSEIAQFLNQAVLKTPLYKTVKSCGRKPILVTADVYKWRFHNYIHQYIEDARKNRGIEYGNIFILSPSNPKERGRGSYNPTILLTNYLADHNIPIHTNTGLQEGCSGTELNHKVVATTFHSSKGRERDLVIVMGFDASYFDYYAIEELRDRCPNALYVALTRATDEMIMVRAYNKEHLPFLDISALEATCESKIIDPARVSTHRRKEALNRTLSVTDLLQHCNYNVLKYPKQFYTEVRSNVNIETNIKATQVDCVMNQVTLTEGVANLNGIIGPLLFEYHRNGSVAYAAALKLQVTNPDFKYWKTGPIREMINKLDPGNLRFPQDFAFLALLMESQGSDGAGHRLRQVCCRSWISEQEGAAIVTSLSAICGSAIEFERPFCDTTPTLGRLLNGRIDILDHSRKTIIEVKYVENITDEHLIQALLYWYLAVKNDEKYRSYGTIVFNIRDGTRVELHPGSTRTVMGTNKVASSHIQPSDALQSMQTVVHFLVESKYAPTENITDEEFLRNTFDLIQNGFDPMCMDGFRMICGDEEVRKMRKTTTNGQAKCLFD